MSNGHRYTQPQKQWLEENAGIIEWKDLKHFTDTFNAVFYEDDNVSAQAVNTYLSKHKIKIR